MPFDCAESSDGLQEVYAGAEESSGPGGQNPGIRGRKKKKVGPSVDRNRAIFRGDVNEGRAGAKLDALVLVVPGLTSFGANTGAAFERAAPLRFEEDARLVARRDSQSHRPVHATGFEARAHPGITGQGDGNRAVGRADILFSAIVLEGERSVLRFQIEFAGTTADRDGAVLGADFEAAIDMVKTERSVVHSQIERGRFRGADEEVGRPTAAPRARDTELAVLEAEMDFGEERVLVPTGFGGLAKSHGVAVLVPTEDLDATVPVGVHAQEGRFGFGNGALLGRDDGGVMVELDVQVRAARNRVLVPA